MEPCNTSFPVLLLDMQMRLCAAHSSLQCGSDISALSSAAAGVMARYSVDIRVAAGCACDYCDGDSKAAAARLQLRKPKAKLSQPAAYELVRRWGKRMEENGNVEDAKHPGRPPAIPDDVARRAADRFARGWCRPDGKQRF